MEAWYFWLFKLDILDFSKLTFFSSFLFSIWPKVCSPPSLFFFFFPHFSPLAAAPSLHFFSCSRTSKGQDSLVSFYNNCFTCRPSVLGRQVMSWFLKTHVFIYFVWPNDVAQHLPILFFFSFLFFYALTESPLLLPKNFLCLFS